ncbi:MAG: ABC transporter ATP-binding protein, partial [Microlunatus sp.]|nr:ABC transporter ATP-binding protein [Microlunatus sp.]
MPEQTVSVGRTRAAGVMVRIAWTADRPRAALAFGLGTAEALAQSLLAWWLKLILDGIAAGDTRQVVAAAAAAGLSISVSAGLSY